MSAVYFHIPFCKRICAYCDFHRFADMRSAADVAEAMERELAETIDFLNDKNVRTVYFGGGTPSLFPPETLQRLIDCTAAVYSLTQGGEITVEVNPDDITARYVKELRHTDINRISIGIQSFDDRVLALMNRRHTAAQAQDAVKRLQDAGYENITADLIFGIDGFGEDVLRHDLQCLLDLGACHVSAYHLTVEPATHFGRMAERGEFKAIDEESSERQFLLIHDTLTAAAFEHYEVSNYALEGRRSQHNSSYWDGTEYIGIGSGAHSFNGEIRRWCRQTPAQYAAKREYEQEVLDERDRFNECIMTSLRRVEGIDLDDIVRRFGEERAARLRSEVQRLEGYGAELRGGRIFIPPERMLTSDAVASSLFEV